MEDEGPDRVDILPQWCKVIKNLLWIWLGLMSDSFRNHPSLSARAAAGSGSRNWFQFGSGSQSEQDQDLFGADTS